MKKTKLMATIIQRTGWAVRRIYENESGTKHVRINGDWYSIDFLEDHGRRIEIWQD